MLGFGSFTVPARREAPQSAAVESPFANWGGSPQAWQEDWQKRYDAEAAKARPATGYRVELMPGATGYDTAASAPFRDQIRQELASRFDREIAGNPTGPLPQEYNSLRDKWVASQMLAYIHPSPWGGSHIVRSPDYKAGYLPDLSALSAERNRMLPLAENQMRQQQAYDWMQGGQQENAVMSPEYANAGFNTITGMSNPYAGPGQIDGVSMDWAQGVYDPTTQRATGTYTPTHQRTNFGW